MTPLILSLLAMSYNLPFQVEVPLPEGEVSILHEALAPAKCASWQYDPQKGIYSCHLAPEQKEQANLVLANQACAQAKFLEDPTKCTQSVFELFAQQEGKITARGRIPGDWEPK